MKADIDSRSARKFSDMASPAFFRPPAISIRPEQLLRVHGYRDPAKVRADIAKAANELAAAAEGLFDTEAHYRRVPIERLDAEGMELAGGLRLVSEVFSQRMAACEEAVVFVLTTGNRLDAQVREHIDRFELIEALFLETSGWLAVEAATRLFARHLREGLASEGMRLSMRLGPGYSYKLGDRSVEWPLEGQRELFRVFEGMTIPVTLLDSCAMKPKLSRSGLYGVVRDRQP
jgi:hypothetical protein